MHPKKIILITTLLLLGGLLPAAENLLNPGPGNAAAEEPFPPTAPPAASIPKPAST